jgi:uncharacterized protein YuzE
MKRFLALFLCVLMAVSLFAGCNASSQTKTGEAMKTGLAVISSTAKSKDAGDADGVGQVDSVAVAVTVDKDGKIVGCAIDTAQTKINFSKEGKITSDLTAEYKSKQELGADYGMAKASTIGKEWNEQANAFAAYVIGKTVEEVKAIKVNEEGVPSDADLAASVTVHIGDYVAAIEKAVANATDAGAKTGDKLGLGLLTTIGKSKDASAEGDGNAQAYTYYAAITFGADGKITSSIIDASQTNIGFSTEGKITSDINAAYKTKNELGEEYGMKKASGIGKEWNEQAAAFAKYVVGKTAAEVAGIAITEGKATDADLASSVTVSIDGMMKVIEKANANAK